jgi:acyl carrier protein
MALRFAAWRLKDEKMKGLEQSTNQIEEWLTAWFVTRSKVGEEAARGADDTLRTTDYFDAGWLSSMEVVEFVTNIEHEFAMQFTDRDLQDARFVTINGLAELIVERTATLQPGLRSS